MRKGYSYIISDGKRKEFRLRRSYGDFIVDTIIMICILALIVLFVLMLIALHPMIPVYLIGGGGTIALIAYIRWKIWDYKWRKENEVPKN
jgi:O-antigen/teichoic acid export membrane protein